MRWLHRSLLAVCLCLGLSGITLADTVTYDALGSALNNTATSTANVSVTIGSNSNRVLICYVDMTGIAQSVSSIVWNTSENLTFIGGRSFITVSRGEWWGLIAPSTGAHTAAVTLSGVNASWDANCISALLLTTLSSCLEDLLKK